MARSRAGLIRSTITRAAVRPVPNPKGLIIALPRRLRIHAACKAAYAQALGGSPLRELPRSSIRTDARLDFSTGMTFLGAGLGRTW
jgi:hypothetical protein